MRCVQFVYLTAAAAFTEVFFRSETIAQAVNFLKGTRFFNPYDLFNGKLFNYGMDRANFYLAAAALFVQFLVSWIQRDGDSLRSRIEVQPLFIRWGVILAAIFAVLLFGVYGPGFDAGQFIYFQF